MNGELAEKLEPSTKKVADRLTAIVNNNNALP